MHCTNCFPFNVFAPRSTVVSLLVICISFRGSAAPLKITIASDSTASSFPPTDYGRRTGWGQVLSNFFNTNIVVEDLASCGRSSKSFYDEGKWATCLATHADYYFIQFGHNDGKKQDPARYTGPESTFKDCLSNYINQARAQGGIPVLLTPPTRRNYESEHVLKRDSLQNYVQAVRELGTTMNVPVLDVLPFPLSSMKRQENPAREFTGPTPRPIPLRMTPRISARSAPGNSVILSWRVCCTPPTPVWPRCKRL